MTDKLQKFIMMQPCFTKWEEQVQVLGALNTEHFLFFLASLKCQIKVNSENNEASVSTKPAEPVDTMRIKIISCKIQIMAGLYF